MSFLNDSKATTLFRFAVLAYVLCCVGTHHVHAQLSAKPEATLGEIVHHVNTLIQNNDSISKIALEDEVEQLVRSDNEVFHRYAIAISSYYGRADKAGEIKKNVLHVFPQGLQARDDAFESLMDNETLNGEQLEKQYAEWLVNYPREKFRKLIRGDDEYGFQVWTYYDNALLRLSQRLIENGDFELADKYIEQLKASSSIVNDYVTIGEALLGADQAGRALPVVKYAHVVAKEQFGAASEAMSAYYKHKLDNTAALCARALFANDHIEEGTDMAQKLYDNGFFSASNTLLLANGLSRQGRDLDAFFILENHMLKNASNEAILQDLERLYDKLNDHKGTFSAYKERLDQRFKEAAINRYQEDLLKEEAPAFSVTDRTGKTITLTDLKGKVVVLDFWATWCRPCINSFPGMQAAVDKYKDDDDVVFLFVNTWQREENYQDVVNRFIEDNQYTFHIVFDEMKDREKAAATAFQVDGIPTKIIIDKDGYIRFKSAGSSDDVAEVVMEMDAKIAMAKRV